MDENRAGRALPPSVEEAKEMVKDRERLVRRLRRQLKKRPAQPGLAEQIETSKRERIVLLNYLTMGGPGGGNMIISGAEDTTFSKHVSGILRRHQPPIARVGRASVTFTTDGDVHGAHVRLDAALEMVDSCLPGVPDVASMRYPTFEARATGATQGEAFETAEAELAHQLTLR